MVAISLLVITGCTGARSGSEGSPGVVGVPAAIHGHVGVYDSVSTAGRSHEVTLVAFDDTTTPPSARTVASAVAGTRAQAHLDLPYVSASGSKVYYLDGDAAVLSVTSTGVKAMVRTLPRGTSQDLVFAVSPDDQRIAVATLDYTTPLHPRESIYVENLAGGGHLDIASSSGPEFYWPVGWHAGKILLAQSGLPALVGTKALMQQPPNPYGAAGYALLDPVAGAKPTSVGPSHCTPAGPITAAGSACIAHRGTQCLGDVTGSTGATYWYTSCLSSLDWNGQETVFLVANSTVTSNWTPTAAALSPDGSTIIADNFYLVGAPLHGAGGLSGLLAYFDPHLAEPHTLGWLDGRHLSFLEQFPDGTPFQRFVVLPADLHQDPRGFVIAGTTFASYQGEPVVAGVQTSRIFGPLVGTLPGGF